MSTYEVTELFLGRSWRFALQLLDREGVVPELPLKE